jgi:hypothetical protein
MRRQTFKEMMLNVTFNLPHHRASGGVTDLYELGSS